MSAPLTTRIWREQPEPDNPLAARSAHCHGYDVYGEMLGHAGWADMLFLLLQGEAPWPEQRALLEMLAVALANAGPRDAAVHAAMASAVGGAPAAAALMAALSVGAGRHGGARDVFDAMTAWLECGADLPAWQRLLARPAAAAPDVWPDRERAAGFEPRGPAGAGIVRQALHAMAGLPQARQLRWLAEHREALEAVAGRPLAMSGVAAAALGDLGLSPAQGEMLFLLLRLPGAAAHALEQGARGYKRFPFPAVQLDEEATA
ncbi:citryl-CoA lyase [Roseateles sp. LKC17W]|uniref:Citryl-CoA lyase n=1 Tax=Pelomonas margarita TaxID=3299031 RepID=A0ABW7FD63_9BURK